MATPDEPFGRQPKPVKVTLEGDPIDIAFWMRHLIRVAQYKGDQIHLPFMPRDKDSFTIYPRAVND